MVVGLRERKKQQTRALLSDTATRMFLERGFDAVRVAEVAAACGVSEKTVFNYFPTKEALLLDRLETTTDALRTGLARPEVPPVRAALAILADERRAALSVNGDPAAFRAAHLRFGDLIRATPSLRAHQSEMLDRFLTTAAEALARRGDLDGGDPDGPRPLIVAAALVGLWRVQYRSLRRHLDGPAPLDEVEQRVRADVEEAGQILEVGLGGG